MTWLTEEHTVGAARERAEMALRIPLGMASPLWLAFGAAASVGVAWWWMTRWTKAVNLEAMTPFKAVSPVLTLIESAPAVEIAPGPKPATSVVATPKQAPAKIAKSAPAPKAAAPAVESRAVVQAEPVRTEPAPRAPVVAETPAAPESKAAEPATSTPETAPITVADAVAAPKAKAVSAKPAPAAPAEPDDLTRLVGIGPKLADALAARGVTQFSQIAAWTADDLARFDAELKLLGRAVRDAWVAQAKRFASIGD
jgi:predicted flap endonuclease-1-like 5' DNA nuclease